MHKIGKLSISYYTITCFDVLADVAFTVLIILRVPVVVGLGFARVERLHAGGPDQHDRASVTYRIALIRFGLAPLG